MKTRFISLIAAISLLIQVSGCLQGGAGSALVSLVNGGGVHGTGISLGPIAAFGSVIVNGTRYDTNNAVILNNGQSISQNDLAIGQIIRVEFDENDNALLVEYVETVTGPVQSINNVNNSLVVLGQAVQITEITAFEETSFTDIVIGDVIEVSGIRDENQVVQASYIELENNSPTYQVTGTISDLNAMTFKISNLNIIHNDPTLAEGMLVDVVGLAGDFDGSTLIASEIRSGFGLHPNAGQEIEIEGIITSFTDMSLFEVNGVVVRTDNNTIVENGLLSDLSLGLEIEVEGIANASGDILASNIKIELESNLELNGVVEAVDLANNTIDIIGISTTVDASTIYKDDSDLQLQLFGIADINVGDYLEIKAIDLGQRLIATKIERENLEDEIKIVGPVNNIDNLLFTLEILGITVFTDLMTEFKNENKVDLTQSAFFATVTEDNIVEAKWDINLGITAPAKEVEIDD